jgi:hypothetical protein
MRSVRSGILYLVLALSFWACSGSYPLELSFTTVNGKQIILSEEIAGHQGTVLAYISPECPLCINYGPSLGRLATEFATEDVGMIGVVSGTYYTPAEVRDYLENYEIGIPVIIDSTFALSRAYGAKFTPEVHLIDKDGTLLYSGAIDNWAISLGQKRLRPTAHYLTDAVKNHLAGAAINPKKTTAVGCFIE